VRRGQALFTVRRGGNTLTFHSPLSGKVAKVNRELEFSLDMMRFRPYEHGWICAIDPTDLSADLAKMRIGADAVAWYQAEVETFRKKLADELAADRPRTKDSHADSKENAEAAWKTFADCFLGVGSGPVRTVAEAPTAGAAK